MLSGGLSAFWIGSFCSVEVMLFLESTIQKCFIHGNLISVQLIERVKLFLLQIEQDVEVLGRGWDKSSHLGLRLDQLLALEIVHGAVSRCDHFRYLHCILQIEQRHCLGHF